jgi:cell division protease FtsH
MVFDKITHERPYSDATAQEIDKEVEGLIREAAKRAELVITSNRDVLERLKDALIQEETLEEEQAEEAMEGAKLPEGAKLH